MERFIQKNRNVILYLTPAVLLSSCGGNGDCDSNGENTNVSAVTYFVNAWQQYFTQFTKSDKFTDIATSAGTTLALGATFLIILVCINVLYKYPAVDKRTALRFILKIGIIGIFATSWIHFNAFSFSVLGGIDNVAESLVAFAGGGTFGSYETLAKSFDDLVCELREYFNTVSEKTNVVGDLDVTVTLLNVFGALLLAILSVMATFTLVIPRIMIVLLIGIAPIMIFFTLFEVTKSYFARWLSTLVYFATYSIIVVGTFMTITSVLPFLITKLDNFEDKSFIDALIPFLIAVFVAKGLIIVTPFIVWVISTNIMRPALSAAYKFGSIFDDIQHAYSPLWVNQVKYVTLRTRQFFGLQPSSTHNQDMNKRVLLNARFGFKMLAQLLARLSRLRRRQNHDD